MYKNDIYEILENKLLAKDVYKMILKGETKSFSSFLVSVLSSIIGMANLMNNFLTTALNES